MEKLTASGLLVIGACHGAELKSVSYDRAACFEPDPNNFAILQRNASEIKDKKIDVFMLALSDASGEADFHLTSSFYSHSLMTLAEPHRKAFPTIKQGGVIRVKVRTLDNAMSECRLDPKLYETIWIDVQGAELKVFRGAVKTLENIKTIMCEVSDVPYYEGGATIDQVDEYLGGFGLKRVETDMWKADSHGYALYKK